MLNICRWQTRQNQKRENPPNAQVGRLWLCLLIEEEDETVNPDDLSMCSEDEYDMVIQDDHPIREEEDLIAGTVIQGSYW